MPFALALAALLLSGAPDAGGPALDPAVAARNDYAAGVRQYRAGQYPAAIESFQAADQLRPSPSLSFDIAQCYERMAELEKARSYYGEYLRRKPDAEDRQAVESTIASIDARLSQPANVPAPAPAPAPILVEVKPPAAPPAETVSAPAPGRRHLAAWLLLGAGAAGLLTGGCLNLAASGAANYPTTLLQPGSAVAGDYTQANHLWTGALVSYLVGAALGLTGAVVYTLDGGGASGAEVGVK